MTPASLAAKGRFPYPPYANGWFRVAYADELARGDVKALHYFGRELVLFRDEEGEAHLLDAFCAHLGAHLGHGGTVEGKGIRCPFHAWHWSGEGVCLDIPYAARIPPKAKIRSWQVRERNGLILAWHHDRDEPPSFEIPVLPEVGSEDWTPYEVRRWTVHSRWLDMNENAVDQIHFRYVHGTHTAPQTEVEVDGHILRCRSRMKMGTPDGEVMGGIDTDDHGPAFQTVRLSGIIDTLMVNTATPIDEDTTDVSFAYTVSKKGGADAHHGAGAAIVRDLEKQMEQDIVIWEHKKYWDKPLLCDGDGKIALYRRWWKQFFSEEAV
ncbi:MAG: Rieske 2Fe-2S domain-containing protein [Proteobacteria bacterium]|nr:Rieske 2Fe-2S domain-containing protein [Pseudomonadota bacterium]